MHGTDEVWIIQSLVLSLSEMENGTRDQIQVVTEGFQELSRHQIAPHQDVMPHHGGKEKKVLQELQCLKRESNEIGNRS